MNTINDPVAALRLARTIASDIMLYNREKVVNGIKEDTLFEILREEIEEGYKLFEARISEQIHQEYNLYERALVDVLIKSSAHVPCQIW